MSMALFSHMQDTHHVRAVQNRLHSLVRQNVISQDVIMFNKYNADHPQPAVQIATLLEQLAHEKRFSGLENSVARFNELLVQGRIQSCLPE